MLPHRPASTATGSFASSSHHSTTRCDMPSTQPGPNSEHRVATYNKGCRCSSCVAAKNAAARRIRSSRRVAEADPRLLRCPECGMSFLGERGLNVHRTVQHY